MPAKPTTTDIARSVVPGAGQQSGEKITRQDIPALVRAAPVLVVVRKQSRVVALLDHHEGHRRLIVRLQRRTSLRKHETLEGWFSRCFPAVHDEMNAFNEGLTFRMASSSYSKT